MTTPVTLNFKSHGRVTTFRFKTVPTLVCSGRKYRTTNETDETSSTALGYSGPLLLTFSGRSSFEEMTPLEHQVSKS